MNNTDKKKSQDDDSFLVDEAGRESFPASDPPSWTTGRDPSDRKEKTEKK